MWRDSPPTSNDKATSIKRLEALLGLVKGFVGISVDSQEVYEGSLTGQSSLPQWAGSNGHWHHAQNRRAPIGDEDLSCYVRAPTSGPAALCRINTKYTYQLSNKKMPRNNTSGHGDVTYC